MAETSVQTQRAPSQFKQPSRKGKKAWRKNVDVTQIQSGLDDIRDEIIQGYILTPTSHLQQALTQSPVVSFPNVLPKNFSPQTSPEKTRSRQTMARSTSLYAPSRLSPSAPPSLLLTHVNENLPKA